jgi:hypothetical protein
MSELTQCNYCSLRILKQKYGEERVTVQPSIDGWQEVFVDGHRVASMLEITEHCVC